MTRAVALVALLCGCTGRALVVPGAGDGSRDFSVVDHDLGVADLAGADLTGADLAGLDLSGVSPPGMPVDMATVPLPQTRGGSVGTGIVVLAADLDGDGLSDLVVVEAAGTVRIYNGNGKGALFPRQSFEINTNTTLATGVLADVDADGVLDLVLAEPGGTKSEVDVLRGNGDATFGDWARVLIPGGVTSVAVGDLNGDGVPDLVATTRDGLLHVMQGTPLGKPQLLIPTYATLAGATQTMLADIDGDGLGDALVVSPPASQLWIAPGKGDLTFGTAVVLPEPGSSARFVLGDWDEDGRVDTAVGGTAQGNADVEASVNSPGNPFGNPEFISTKMASTSGIDGLAMGDMNGDGNADLVVTTDASQTLLIAYGDGMGLFGTFGMIPIDEGATSLALADFDSDGHLDVAAAGATKTQLYLTQP